MISFWKLAELIFFARVYFFALFMIIFEFLSTIFLEGSIFPHEDRDILNLGADDQCGREQQSGGKCGCFALHDVPSIPNHKDVKVLPHSNNSRLWLISSQVKEYKAPNWPMTNDQCHCDEFKSFKIIEHLPNLFLENANFRYYIHDTLVVQFHGIFC